MSTERPFVISIAGLDPSGGAGLLADIKTFEMHKVQGLGIATAITFQNEAQFHGMKWLPEADILNQLESLLAIYQPRAVKVGIIKSLDLLDKLCLHLKSQFPEVKIVWDPVLKATSGYDFLQELNREQLANVLSGIDLLTPNIPECEQLFGTNNPQLIAEKSTCPVLLKGGHSNESTATDYLIYKGKTHQFSHLRKTGFSKHGTGCILSSSIAANLALGMELPDACQNAKEYIQFILSSNNSRLAYHHE